MTNNESNGELLSPDRQRKLAASITALALIIILGLVASRFILKDDDTAPPRSAEVVYLSPASSSVSNLALTDIYSQQTRLLTQYEQGVDDSFGVSADGSHIAFALRTVPASPLLDIFMVDVKSGAISQLTNCADAQASCFGPTWHPNGNFVGFTREERAEGIEDINRKRAWVVNLTSGEESLLFADEQIIGHTPRWSPDGNKVALVSINPVGILIFDYTTDEITSIPTQQNVIGSFSPDSTVFIYPQLQQGAAGSTYYSQIELVNFETGIMVPVSGGRNSPIEDISASFSPDGSRLVVVRRYLDNRFTNGGQLYLIDLETGQTDPLLVDERFSHGSPSWTKDGASITFQRFDFDTTAVDIWRVDVKTGALTLVAEDGLLPKILP